MCCQALKARPSPSVPPHQILAAHELCVLAELENLASAGGGVDPHVRGEQLSPLGEDVVVSAVGLMKVLAEPVQGHLVLDLDPVEKVPNAVLIQ